MSLVRELQYAAVNSDISASDLLRKTLLVAKRLKHEELEKWASAELFGYDDVTQVPEYRKLKGTVMFLDYLQNTWRPITSRYPDDLKEFSTMSFPAPLVELEDVSTGTRPIVSTYTGEHEHQLMQRTVDQFGQPLNSKIALFIMPGSFKGIIERVKNKILEWSFKLEDLEKNHQRKIPDSAEHS